MANPDSHLDPKSNPRNSPDDPGDRRSNTVATPEGDNEYGPDEPLGSIDNPGSEPLQPTPRSNHGPLQTPRGGAPSPYNRDHK